MPSSKKNSSRKAPSARIPARPAEPSNREKELLALTKVELLKVVLGIGTLRDKLRRLRCALKAFEPRAYVVAVIGGERYSEVGIAIENLGDCMDILASAEVEIDPEEQTPALELIASLAKNEREFPAKKAAREKRERAAGALPLIEDVHNGRLQMAPSRVRIEALP